MDATLQAPVVESMEGNRPGHQLVLRPLCDLAVAILLGGPFFCQKQMRETSGEEHSERFGSLDLLNRPVSGSVLVLVSHEAGIVLIGRSPAWSNAIFSISTPYVEMDAILRTIEVEHRVSKSCPFPSMPF